MIDYKKSGVDVQTGDELVGWLQSSLLVSSDRQNGNSKDSSHPEISVKKSDQDRHSERIVEGIGGFAALFNGHFPKLKNPTLVACTDGVGTKVKIASYFEDYSTVGFDLVAMCVNDLICTGGDPLFFLDYYAVDKLRLENAKQFLTGIKLACQSGHLALIGGETAEMPGVYQKNDFDCAGFSVGIVERDLRWGSHLVQENDVIVGFESSGFHSNGYSLLRTVFDGEFEKYRTWLMEPTRIYVELIQSLKQIVTIHAAAHITGGGIENLPRVIAPEQCIYLKKWTLPEPFLEVQRRTKLSDMEMLKTLNCGVGFAIYISRNEVEKVLAESNKLGIKAFEIGTVALKDKMKTGESLVVQA